MMKIKKTKLEKSFCGFCAVPLDDNNRSEVMPAVSYDNQPPRIICQCVFCNEVLNRLYDNRFIENGVMVFKKTELQIRDDIQKEGWSYELLKTKEEMQCQPIH